MSGQRILLVLPGNPATGSVKGSKRNMERLQCLKNKFCLATTLHNKSVFAVEDHPLIHFFSVNDSCLEVHRSTTASVPQNNFCGPPFYPADTMDKLVSQGFSNKQMNK